MTQELVVLGGLGDVYLVAALYESFCRHHECDAELIVKSGHAAFVNLLHGIRYRVDDDLIAYAEDDHSFQENYENELFIGRPFYPHPCLTRTRIDLTPLTTIPRVSQATMFRSILRLPPESPLALPVVPQRQMLSRTVMIVEANTWPNTQPAFYPRLIEAMTELGWSVWVNDRELPLRQLLERCAETAWIIGPQCGLMSILVTGRWPCRKTIATPSIDGGCVPEYWASETYPYAYTSTFADQDFDIEEFKITSDNHDDVIAAIMAGKNALRFAYDPGPVSLIYAPLSPGDFLDRLAILTNKRRVFSPSQRARIEREYQRLTEIKRQQHFSPQLEALFERLILVASETYDLLAEAVPDALGHGWMDPQQHVRAMRLNEIRVRLKQQIDEVAHGAFSEIKSYYAD